MQFGLGIEQELPIIIDLKPDEKKILYKLLGNNYDYYNLLELENNGIIIIESEIQDLNSFIDFILENILLKINKNLFKLESEIMLKSILLQFINYNLKTKFSEITLENINLYQTGDSIVDSDDDIIYYYEKVSSKSIKINKKTKIFFENWKREILSEQYNGTIDYLTIIYLSNSSEIKYLNQISKIEKDIGGLEFKNDIYNTNVTNVIKEIKIKI